MIQACRAIPKWRWTTWGVEGVSSRGWQCRLEQNERWVLNIIVIILNDVLYELIHVAQLTDVRDALMTAYNVGTSGSLDEKTWNTVWTSVYRRFVSCHALWYFDYFAHLYVFSEHENASPVKKQKREKTQRKSRQDSLRKTYAKYLRGAIAEAVIYVIVLFFNT